MIFEFKDFQTALAILKNNTVQNVMDSLRSIENHLEILEVEYKQQVHEFRRMFIQYKKHEKEMGEKKKRVEKEGIRPWIPLLKRHQKASIFENVKAETVQRIGTAKKEIDYINYSLDEYCNLLTKKAKEVQKLNFSIKKKKTQIFVLEIAFDLGNYLNAHGYDPKEIADFEVQKYYEMFRKEVV